MFELSEFKDNFLQENVEAGGSEDHTDQDEQDENCQVGLTWVEAPESNGCQRHEAEVEALEVSPTLDVRHDNSTAQDVAHHQKDAEEDWTRHLWLDQGLGPG